MQLLAVFAAGSVLFAAGCDQRNTSTTATPADKMANAANKAADKTAAAAENAADKVADATKKVGEKIDDAAITAKVKTALMAEPGLRSLAIDVDTRDNIVTLNGTVNSAESKVKAMQVAQSVEGVKSVADNLVIKSS
jgi:hyperosmotically inducible protein